MRKIDSYFPDVGPLRRELYPKHRAFFAGGKDNRQRLMLAANRVGKTESVGLYELALHLTGEYPAWWVGHRFDRPIKAWAAGDTSKTVRDILQIKMLGPLHDMGTGVLPGKAIVGTSRNSGVANSVDNVRVRHVSGGESSLTFKSYDQRRESFQGSEIDVILLDEEPPIDIYTECLIRTMTNGGIIMLTFTPLQGMSETVLAFLPGGELREDGDKFVIMATWDDVPHLSEDVKQELLLSIPPFQRDARSKGVPQLGAGAIYPVSESDILVEPFDIPDSWEKCYGLDVGWNRTACVWGAIDPASGACFLFAEHYRAAEEPVIHAAAIKTVGDWIPGVIDPAARGRGQKDGVQLFQMYRDLGLDIMVADNSVETGIYETWQMLSLGKLKVFKNLENWKTEFRMYARDDKGRIMKRNDHLMDATRYLVMSGIDRARNNVKRTPRTQGQNHGGWLG